MKGAGNAVQGQKAQALDPLQCHLRLENGDLCLFTPSGATRKDRLQQLLEHRRDVHVPLMNRFLRGGGHGDT